MVSADAARTVVGIIGNATALMLFLAPVPTFWRIWRSRSVEQFSAAPYLAALLNCMFWVVYGLPAVQPHSTLVLTINGAGLLIELLYVIAFLGFSGGGRRLRVLLALVAEVLFVGSVGALVLALVRGQERRSMVVGALCVIFATLMYAAPLSVMRQVISRRSVEFMPFSLSLASFVNGLCWTAYAVIRFDLFIIIPNALGVAFAVAQLVLHVMYRESTARETEERERDTEMMTNADGKCTKKDNCTGLIDA